jgi:hypothetical protein
VNLLCSFLPSQTSYDSILSFDYNFQLQNNLTFQDSGDDFQLSLLYGYSAISCQENNQTSFYNCNFTSFQGELTTSNMATNISYTGGNHISLYLINNGFCIFSKNTVDLTCWYKNSGDYTQYLYYTFQDSTYLTDVSVFPNNMGFLITSVPTAQDDIDYYVRSISPCLRQLYRTTDGCLSNFASPPPSHAYDALYYYKICPVNGSYSDNFCCDPSFCQQFSYHQCDCPASNPLNSTCNVCQPCPIGSQECVFQNGNFVAVSCQANYTLFNNIVCCGPGTSKCVYTQGNSISTQCNSYYRLLAGYCYPPFSAACYVLNGSIINTCNQYYYPVNNFCCPIGSLDCNLSSNGIIIPSHA